eukprot:12409038-Alexandrium_andersonii.AAC.1
MEEEDLVVRDIAADAECTFRPERLAAFGAGNRWPARPSVHNPHLLPADEPALGLPACVELVQVHPEGVQQPSLHILEAVPANARD